MVVVSNPSSIPSQNPPKKISWEEFQRKYLSREDKYKYEWVDGTIEKTPRTMDKSQFYIHDNLMKLLDKLKAEKGIRGRLLSEGDTFFAGKHRRPDIAFYTEEQIRQAKEGENVVPQFVIEIISTQDQMNRVHKKMKNYREAKVPVVWQIFPDLKEVHVYHGKKMQVCHGEDVCSAEAVIVGFRMGVEEVFG
ncbi:MAG: Uma2 family endonuclease [Lewinellaceae bacterium]|nr:Uma2 family endonuclease [Saprospiraceae bacterium]MCB9341231.1 Uma2 family endonuclease [Lewinellaceae bacterium]